MTDSAYQGKYDLDLVLGPMELVNSVVKREFTVCDLPLVAPRTYMDA